MPGYTCEGGAKVEVLIEVNPSGRVGVDLAHFGGRRKLFWLGGLAKRTPRSLQRIVKGSGQATGTSDLPVRGAVMIPIQQLQAWSM